MRPLVRIASSHLELEVNSLLFIFSQPPHRSINAQESLDALLMGSAFTSCSVLFLGDGLLQLLSDQATNDLGTKNFSLSFSALTDYGVTRIACSQPDLTSRGLNIKDFVITVEPLELKTMRCFISKHDKVLNF